MLGDQPQELVRVEARHEHQVVAEQQAAAAVVNPVLWLSGTDSRLTSPSCPCRADNPIAAGTRLSPPASISLGRPVLPPDAIDFHTGDTASGSGASDSVSVGREIRCHAGDHATRDRRGRRSARAVCSSRIAANSASGSRGDNGCGTAPSFQHASTACTHSIELGIAIVT